MGDQTEGLKAAQRIFKIVEESKTSSIDGLATTGITPTTRAVGNIELRNVTFCYPGRPDVEVCKNYNLNIHAGK